MTRSIGIIGAGRIGLAAAREYIKEGYEVNVYDTKSHALQSAREVGARPCSSPAEVARHSHIILILVLNDEQVNTVVNGTDGLLSELTDQHVVVCMSTVQRNTVTSIAQQCSGKGAGIIDCPFTGGAARVANKSLTLITAGDESRLKEVMRELEVVGRVTYLGPDVGMAQALKHCNQLLVGITHAATMEVITLSRKLNLDPSVVASVITSGIAGSDYFHLLSESVLKNTPSPGGLGQICKDMSIVTDTLQSVGMFANVGMAAAAYFELARARGLDESEGADLIKIIEELNATPS